MKLTVTLSVLLFVALFSGVQTLKMKKAHQGSGMFHLYDQ